MNLPSISTDPANSIINIFIIILVTFILTRLVAYSMNKVKRFDRDITAIYLIRDIISNIIYFIALMLILQYFGINLAGTLLSVGIVGIAVSFAAKDIISNLFSGIMLILERSVKVGDTIEINGEKGYVEKVSLRSTVIIDDYGVKNHIPNSVMTNNEYLEYKEPEKYRVDILSGLPLNIDIVDFREYLISKMESYPAISDNPKPDVYGKEISFKQSKIKVSFWVNNFNDEDKYKIIITNDIRKYVQIGEKDE